MSEADNKNRQDVIIEMRDYAKEQFDKLIVYLYSGTLKLTIGFVKYIMKITKETDTSLLNLSGSSFIVSKYGTHQIKTVNTNYYTCNQQNIKR